MTIDNRFRFKQPDDITRSLILALGVCYHAGLQDAREKYRQQISSKFQNPLSTMTSISIDMEIER